MYVEGCHDAPDITRKEAFRVKHTTRQKLARRKRRIERRASERTDMIERPRQGHDTVPRNTSVRRLQPCDANERRRNRDRSTGVRAQRKRQLTRANRGA